MKSTLFIILALAFGMTHIVILFPLNYGDAVINIIYARNFSSGGFFEFNPGEKSFGSSSPFWVVLLAGVLKLFPQNTVLGAKLAGSALYLLTFPLLFIAARNIFPGRRTPVFAVFFWSYFSPPAAYGAAAFETVLLINLVLIFAIIIRAVLGREKEGAVMFFLAGLVSGLLILCRFESFLFLLAAGLTVIIRRFAFLRKEWKKFLLLILVFLATVSPYFAYSYGCSGSALPSSGKARLQEAKASASLNGASFWSPGAVCFFIARKKLILIILAAAAFLILGRKGKLNPVSIALAVWFFLDLIFFTFIFPGARELERYLYPLVAVLILFSASGIDTISKLAASLEKISPAVIRLALIIFFIALNSLGIVNSLRLSSSAVPFDLLVEKKLAGWFNSTVPAEERILTYEVQQKFYLKNPVLSLDGIIGGEVLPYLFPRGNISEFLKKYRPSYWVMGSAVLYRPEYRETILRDIAKRPEGDQGSSYEAEGIGFTLMKKAPPDRKEYPGFSAYRRVYRLDYK